MSSIFDHYRHPAWCLLFFFFSLFYLSWVMLLGSVYPCSRPCTSVSMCEAEGEGGKKEGWSADWVFFFLKRGKMTIIIFNPPSRYPSEIRFFLFRVRWKQPGTGIEQKVPSDHKQTFRWITSKALPQLLALSYLRKIGSLRAKKKRHCLH